MAGRKRGQIALGVGRIEPAAFHPHPTGHRLPLVILLPPDQGEAIPPPAIEGGHVGHRGAGARPYSGSSEGWGHRMEMGPRVRSARCSTAKESQRRCTLSVGSAGAQLVGAVLRLCLFQSCARRKLWSLGFKNPLQFS